MMLSRRSHISLCTICVLVPRFYLALSVGHIVSRFAELSYQVFNIIFLASEGLI